MPKSLLKAIALMLLSCLLTTSVSELAVSCQQGQPDIPAYRSPLTAHSLFAEQALTAALLERTHSYQEKVSARVDALAASQRPAFVSRKTSPFPTGSRGHPGRLLTLHELGFDHASAMNHDALIKLMSENAWLALKNYRVLSLSGVPLGDLHDILLRIRSHLDEDLPGANQEEFDKLLKIIRLKLQTPPGLARPLEPQVLHLRGDEFMVVENEKDFVTRHKFMADHEVGITSLGRSSSGEVDLLIQSMHQALRLLNGESLPEAVAQIFDHGQEFEVELRRSHDRAMEIDLNGPVPVIIIDQRLLRFSRALVWNFMSELTHLRWPERSESEVESQVLAAYISKAGREAAVSALEPFEDISVPVQNMLRILRRPAGKPTKLIPSLQTELDALLAENGIQELFEFDVLKGLKELVSDHPGASNDRARLFLNAAQDAGLPEKGQPVMLRELLAALDSITGVFGSDILDLGLLPLLWRPVKRRLSPLPGGPSGIEIVPATPADWPALEAFAEEYIYPEIEDLTPTDIEVLQRMIQWILEGKTPGIVLTARAGSRIAGMGAAAVVEDHGYLVVGGVEEDYRRQGLGTRLAQARVDWLALHYPEIGRYLAEDRSSGGTTTRILKKLGFESHPGMGYLIRDTLNPGAPAPPSASQALRAAA